MRILVLADVESKYLWDYFEKEKLEQLNVYQNRQLKLMHQMDEELRIQRHDFQKHISMLAFMNSQGEKEKLTAYLNEMQEGELFQTKFERTDNFVIDSILSYKLQESDRLGIETKMDVKVPKDLNVSAYVLTGILTNLLDNAIEACEKVQDKKIKITIKYAKKMLIIRISNTYDGKEKKPGVTVTDWLGDPISKSEYTVTYPKSAKNVGKYTVTIKFKNHYVGTEKRTFTINPKGTSVSKVTAAKKGFKVTWKKQAAQTTGYQVQYSTDKNFKKGNKTVTVKGAKTTAKTISKLTKGKKYYVRVRTYKTVNKTNFYSGWSKSSSVTVKK